MYGLLGSYSSNLARRMAAVPQSPEVPFEDVVSDLLERRFSPVIGICPIRAFSLSKLAGGVGFLIAGCATMLRKAVIVREARCILNSVLQEKIVVSSEERVGKFLKYLLERKSALGVPQSLSSPAPEESARIPGGSPVSFSTVNKRWQLIPHSEETRRASLLTQRACLAILGLPRSGQPRALAIVCPALAPAGEVSLTSAICADEFARAPRKLACGRDAGQKADNG